jgi:hypothetical protein
MEILIQLFFISKNISRRDREHEAETAFGKIRIPNQGTHHDVQNGLTVLLRLYPLYHELFFENLLKRLFFCFYTPDLQLAVAPGDNF